jgi:GAF domain-containing protein
MLESASAATLAAQVRALETLLEVQERIVLEQTARLETSLEQERAARRSLQALDEVAGAIASQMALADVVQLAVEAARELTGAAFAAFFFDRQGAADGRYRLYALSGADRETFERYPLPRGPELFGSTFGGNEVLRVDDLPEDRRYQCETAERGMAPDRLLIRSYLAVPVNTAGGGVDGGLFLGHSEARMFTAATEVLAVSLARHASIAIANSRLYEASQRESEARRVAFGERDVIAILNDALLQDQSDRFVTAVFARLDPDGAGYRMRVCVAGHPPVLLARAGGPIHLIEPETCLLGMYNEIEPVEQAFDLEPDDVLVLYTDGLIETRRNHETFGEQRLNGTLSEHRHASCESLADELLAASQEFATSVVNDDTALLVARLRARHGAEQ